ncbi:MAG: hypothetical protein ACI9LF_001173 [Flavobacteriales bacterium]|jgi:hypothetical protein
MTALEMYNNFQLEYDRVASDAAKGWLPDEIAWFINSYSSDLLRIKTEESDNAKRQSYIFPFKRSQLLILSLDQTGVTGPNSQLFEMPTDYPGRSEKEVVKWVNCDFISLVTPVTDDEYFSINIDETKSSSTLELRRLLMNRPSNSESLIELFLPKDSNLVVNEYLITYIREPRLVVINLNDPTSDINSEFASNKHYEIVRGAVLYALEAAADSRLQTFPVKPINFN